MSVAAFRSSSANSRCSEDAENRIVAPLSRSLLSASGAAVGAFVSGPAWAAADSCRSDDGEKRTVAPLSRSLGAGGAAGGGGGGGGGVPAGLPFSGAVFPWFALLGFALPGFAFCVYQAGGA
ncbi:hypothetical protein GTY65_34145 [Streptomyces sp. SID8379]|uniref:hypothetical protein n=1 Tax=unclassified Streptomyces TaxID=2593676 RepID=UPI00035E13E3|nr:MULTISPECIES: hypothetical protein [unclassified Streptomyces]MYW69079.1 hypothetical protein [Streptomyces sp. SID8379]